MRRLPRKRSALIGLTVVGGVGVVVSAFLWGYGVPKAGLFLFALGAVALCLALWGSRRRGEEGRKKPSVWDRRPRFGVFSGSAEGVEGLLEGLGARPLGCSGPLEPSGEAQWWGSTKVLYKAIPMEGLEAEAARGNGALGLRSFTGLLLVVDGAQWAAQGRAMARTAGAALRSGAAARALRGCPMLALVDFGGLDAAYGVTLALGPGALSFPPGAITSEAIQWVGARLRRSLAGASVLRLSPEVQGGLCHFPAQMVTILEGLQALEGVGSGETLPAIPLLGTQAVGGALEGLEEDALEGRILSRFARQSGSAIGRRAGVMALALCLAVVGAGWLESQVQGALAWGERLGEGMRALGRGGDPDVPLTRGEVESAHLVISSVDSRPWLPQCEELARDGEAGLMAWSDTRLLVPLGDPLGRLMGAALNPRAGDSESLTVARGYRGLLAFEALATPQGAATSTLDVEEFLVGLWGERLGSYPRISIPRAELEPLVTMAVARDEPSDLAAYPGLADLAQALRGRIDSGEVGDDLELILALMEAELVNSAPYLPDTTWGDATLWRAFTPEGCAAFLRAPNRGRDLEAAYIAMAAEARRQALLSLEPLQPRASGDAVAGLEVAGAILRRLSGPEAADLQGLLGGVDSGEGGPEPLTPDACRSLGGASIAPGDEDPSGSTFFEILRAYQGALRALEGGVQRVILSSDVTEGALSLLSATLDDRGPLYEAMLARGALVTALDGVFSDGTVAHIDVLLESLEGLVYAHVLTLGLEALDRRWADGVYAPVANLRAQGRRGDAWEVCPQLQGFFEDELQTFLGEQVSPLLGQGGSLGPCDVKSLYGRPIPLNPLVCRQGKRALRTAGTCTCGAPCTPLASPEIVGLRGAAPGCAQGVAALRLDTGDEVFEWRNATDQLGLSPRPSRGKPRLYVAMSRDPGGRGRYLSPPGGGKEPRDLAALLEGGEEIRPGVYRFKGARRDACPGGVTLEIETSIAQSPCGAPMDCQFDGISFPKSLWE